MTLKEAKIAAKKGEKITHRFFSNDEYVTVLDGSLRDEKNYILNWNEFFELRKSISWQTDWNIFNPNKI